MKAYLPKTRKEKSARRSARSAQWAILVLGVHLFLMFVGGVLIVRHLINNLAEEWPNYLELVGRAISDPPREYFNFLAYVTNPDTGEVDQELLEFYYPSEEGNRNSDSEGLRRSLQSAVGEEFIESAYILTPSGVIIWNDAGQPVEEASRQTFVDVERQWVDRAAQGTIAMTDARVAQLPYVIYFPLRDTINNEVVALLRLEADTERYMRLRIGRLLILRNRLFFGSIISFFVLLFLYITTVRLVKRTIVAERVAAQSDRLRSLGTMTAGIAHEIRNPLGILLLQIEELEAITSSLEGESSRQEIQTICDELKTETLRLKELTEDFLRFSNASNSEKEREQIVDVLETARNAFQMWQKGVDSHLRKVELEINVSKEQSVYIAFSEDRLKQILLNLLRNADEALADKKGEIYLRVETTASEVRLIVEDNGPGISGSADEIFDPFYTTRAKGTGLGLSLSRAMTESAGGDLVYNSDHKQGAQFILSFPLIKQSDSTTTN